MKKIIPQILLIFLMLGVSNAQEKWVLENKALPKPPIG